MKNFLFFRGETLKEARWSRHYHKSWVWSGERVKSQAPLWEIQPYWSLCQLFLFYSHQFRTGCIKQVLTSALRQLNMHRFHLRGLKLLDRSQYLCFPFLLTLAKGNVTFTPLQTIDEEDWNLCSLTVNLYRQANVSRTLWGGGRENKRKSSSGFEQNKNQKNIIMKLRWGSRKSGSGWF